MSKATSKTKNIAEKITIVSTKPWTCTHFGNTSEIDAFNKNTGEWETLAVVQKFANFDAEDIADFIVHAVNNS